MPAIIDSDTWDCVQKKMVSNKRTASGRPATVRNYPLKGKVFCGECGATMVGTTSKYKYHYYACTGKQRLQNCELLPISMDTLEKSVANAVRQVFGNADNIDHLIGILQREGDRITSRATDHLRTLLGKSADINRQLEQATTAVLNGLNSATLTKRIHLLENERAGIELDIQQLRQSIDAASIPIVALRNLFETAISTDDTATLLSLVTRVEVYHDTIKVWTILDGEFDNPPRNRSFFDDSALVPVDAIALYSCCSEVIKTTGVWSPAPKNNDPFRGRFFWGDSKQ